MKERLKSLCCPMSPQQEEGYQLFCAQKILRYSIGLLMLIVVIQLYNMVYVLFYTGWQLNTAASRVYMVLYVLMFLIATIGLGLSLF